MAELIHVGSLIVDDIQDGSDLRRGGPTVHKAYGVPLAINAGSSAYFTVFHFLDALDVSVLCRPCRGCWSAALCLCIPRNRTCAPACSLACRNTSAMAVLTCWCGCGRCRRLRRSSTLCVSSTSCA
jgi:hypothetical protein